MGKRFCRQFSESCSVVVLQLLMYNGKQERLSDDCLPNILPNLTPQLVPCLLVPSISSPRNLQALLDDIRLTSLLSFYDAPGLFNVLHFSFIHSPIGLGSETPPEVRVSSYLEFDSKSLLLFSLNRFAAIRQSYDMLACINVRSSL